MIGESEQLCRADVLMQGRGGEGGHGGEGGRGGVGSNGGEGEPGHPGKPGEPGEPGERVERGSGSMTVGRIPIAQLATLAVAIFGGVYWLIGLESKIALVNKDFTSFRDNVLALNTPLSQRVFSAEARLNEIARIQSEVRAALTAIDQNGTSKNQILQNDMRALQVSLAGQATRHAELDALMVKLQNDTIETRVRLQFLIEAIMPHNRKKGDPSP